MKNLNTHKAAFLKLARATSSETFINHNKMLIEVGRVFGACKGHKNFYKFHDYLSCKSDGQLDNWNDFEPDNIFNDNWVSTTEYHRLISKKLFFEIMYCRVFENQRGPLTPSMLDIK